jgi:DNA helicase-2/ATP-dependent DNA helicase PcrA
MREAYADDSDESINKRANIEEFINSVEEYSRLNPEAGLTDYLNQVTLSSDTDEMDDGNYVTLATVHSVKGLEFRCVFICGLEENILPVSRAVENDDDMEEERRLMYVAITRAKETLTLTHARQRMLYGRTNAALASRFLKEIPEDITVKKGGFQAASGYSSYGQSYTKPQQPAKRPSFVQTPQAPVPCLELNKGDMVDHTAFGRGLVLSVLKMGGDALLEIAFDRVGTKKLMAKTASAHMKKL